MPKITVRWNAEDTEAAISWPTDTRVVPTDAINDILAAYYDTNEQVWFYTVWDGTNGNWEGENQYKGMLASTANYADDQEPSYGMPMGRVRLARFNKCMDDAKDERTYNDAA